QVIQPIDCETSWSVDHSRHPSLFPIKAGYAADLIGDSGSFFNRVRAPTFSPELIPCDLLAHRSGLVTGDSDRKGPERNNHFRYHSWTHTQLRQESRNSSISRGRVREVFGMVNGESV